MEKTKKKKNRDKNKKNFRTTKFGKIDFVFL